MQIKTVTPAFTVSEQLNPTDVAALAEMGVDTIICNRPDNEQPDQPLFSSIAAEAERAGIEAVHIPVVPGQIGPQQVLAMAEALSQGNKIHGFCRTGMRSTMLWSLVEAGKGTLPEQILALAKQAGFDVSGVLQQTQH